jgi:hypothetical protein
MVRSNQTRDRVLGGWTLKSFYLFVHFGGNIHGKGAVCDQISKFFVSHMEASRQDMWV